ncbi:MAG: hypothetical protein IRY94_04460 [Rhodospirillaceae bacterium]|nr:hypothetical protein [Rhodospirillaceae bacterium]
MTGARGPLAAILLASALCAGGPAAAAGAPVPGAPAVPVVSAEGYGAVRFGMTPAQAEALLQRPLRPLAPAAGRPCVFLYPDGDPNAIVAFLLSGGRIERIDVRSRAVPTGEGVRIGDSEARLLALYAGRTVVEPRRGGGPDDRLVTVRDADGTHALVFETRGGRVVAYHAGRLPEATYVAGCS